MVERLLIKGGTIIAVAPGAPAEFIGDLLIEDGVIRKIAPSIDVDEGSTEVVDASGTIVTPGFVDTHRHMWQTPFRYAGADWTIAQYATAMWGMAGPKYEPEDQYVAIRLALLDALNAGVTQVYDWNHNVNSPEHADATVQAHRDSGGACGFRLWAGFTRLVGLPRS